jgi:hypothetical protein
MRSLCANGLREETAGVNHGSMSSDRRPGVHAADCSDARLTLEFAYTSWQQSCRNLYTIEQACRRPRGHEGEHAAGYGGARSRWVQ